MKNKTMKQVRQGALRIIRDCIESVEFGVHFSQDREAARRKIEDYRERAYRIKFEIKRKDTKCEK